MVNIAGSVLKDDLLNKPKEGEKGRQGGRKIDRKEGTDKQMKEGVKKENS